LENVHTNKDQFFINAYFPGYHFGKERDGKPRKTNVTIEPKLGKSEVAFTAGIVIPDNAPVKEVEMLDSLTSAMESAGFQRLYDCNLKERENAINSKRVFLLSRQSTSVEKWGSRHSSRFGNYGFCNCSDLDRGKYLICQNYFL
jgi:hypothetical protein